MQRKIFITYISIFYFLWIIYVAVFYPYLEFINRNSIQYALLNLLIRVIIWVVPAVVYLASINVSAKNVRNLFTIPLKGVAFSLLLSLVFFGINILIQGNPNIKLDGIDINTLINTILFVPVIEEFVFRGVIINHIYLLSKTENLFLNNLFTSFLFLVIHIPGWVLYSPNIPIYYPISIILLSLLVGYFSQKYKTIIPSILIHIVNNIFSEILW